MKSNFIIARLWDEDEYPTEKGRLCVYTSHNKEVHYGTKKDAYDMAEIISKMTDRKYEPYFIEIHKELSLFY